MENTQRNSRTTIKYTKLPKKAIYKRGKKRQTGENQHYKTGETM